MNRSTELGRTAEDAACAYLARLGMRVMRRNVRAGGGEIDIIACEPDGTIVFVEVKARGNRRFGSAIAGVDARKRRRLRAAADDWLQVLAPSAKARFDVLTIEGSRMTLHRNAFE